MHHVPASDVLAKEPVLPADSRIEASMKPLRRKCVSEDICMPFQLLIHLGLPDKILTGPRGIIIVEVVGVSAKAKGKMSVFGGYSDWKEASRAGAENLVLS
jgi:hypothetical protein